jgi:2-oxoisovalerate dehydrogenase E2 component (dihydrolipoyl transacylase)
MKIRSHRSRNYTYHQPSTSTLENIMKKYLSLAAVLGAIAFLSVSTMAQAQAPAAPAAPAAAAPAAPATGGAMMAAPAAGAYAKDRMECDALASAPSTEGAAPSDADKEASIKKCLAGKGHSADEITKSEAANSPAAPAAPATPPTP